MTGIEGRVIRAVDISATSFRNSFGAIKDLGIRREILESLRVMLGQAIDSTPRKWHMHQLHDKLVPSRVDPKKKVPAWSLHVTADDRYKASFTLEDCHAYFRLVDEHDIIDKHP